MKPLRPYRLAPLGALSLLANGCIQSARTPADAVSDGDNEPHVHSVLLPGRNEVFARWQLPPTTPWAPYQKFTLPAVLGQLATAEDLPDVLALEEVVRAYRAGQRAAELGIAEDALWIVDLRGAASVAFGSALSRHSRAPVALVPTFNNWPADNELVPAEETLAAMILLAPLPWKTAVPDATRARRPVFLLDAWRLAYKGEEIDSAIFDNRYMLSEAAMAEAAVRTASTRAASGERSFPKLHGEWFEPLTPVEPSVRLPSATSTLAGCSRGASGASPDPGGGAGKWVPRMLASSVIRASCSGPLDFTERPLVQPTRRNL